MQIADDFLEGEQDGGEGVLKAAAMAAAAPTGIRALTFSGRKPRVRPRTEAIPEPTWTAGPSRPRGMPLARVTEVQKNLPKTVRKEMRPS